MTSSNKSQKPTIMLECSKYIKEIYDVKRRGQRMTLNYLVTKVDLN